MVLQGPDKGQRFKLIEGQSLLIGRAGDALPITDYTVSRRHAEIRPIGRSWYIDDLRSANGTYLNGKRIERQTRLKHGDQIRMGSTLAVWDSTGDHDLRAAAEGTAVASDRVALDAGSEDDAASIIDTVPSSDDSMILASPAAAEAVRAWRVMSELLDAVGSVRSPQELARRTMEILSEEVPLSRGFVLLRDPKSGKFETEVVHYEEDSGEQIRTSRRIVDHVIEQRESILCSNTMSDARFNPVGDAGGSIQAMGLQSVICVPMIAREEVLGVIYIDSPMARHIYTEDQLRLVATIGQMAALAIEHARLVSERMQTERLAATGETVAALSHYIKNILQGMMGGSDVVEMGLGKQHLGTVDQGWQVVQRNLNKIYSLTMNMLAFAKRREPRLEPVQFNAVVEDVLKLVKRRAADRGILLKADLYDDAPAVMMDENGIHQVVTNIITNAIDAVSKSTGVVTVRTAYDPAGERVTLTVGDNGPGIPEPLRDRIFEAFYSTKGHGGTGLGLAVAKKIVDEHAGHISVKSVEGEGTIVRVNLPINPRKSADSEATHGPAAR